MLIPLRFIRASQTGRYHGGNMEENKNRKTHKQVLILSIIAFIGSGYFLIQNVITISKYTKTDAIVLEVKTINTPGSGTSRSYKPTVHFTTKSGKNVTLQTGYGSSMFKFRKGDRITVYYNPKDSSFFVLLHLNQCG
jgi:hypothetical protein